MSTKCTSNTHLTRRNSFRGETFPYVILSGGEDFDRGTAQKGKELREAGGVIVTTQVHDFTVLLDGSTSDFFDDADFFLLDGRYISGVGRGCETSRGCSSYMAVARNY